tara:strand:+ start:231 stop:341 length:111 start_codon:yes stop_codon:yes gene_type:complete
MKDVISWGISISEIERGSEVKGTEWNGNVLKGKTEV